MRPNQFVLGVEGATRQVSSYPIPSLGLKTPLEAEDWPMSAIYFCVWFLSQAIHSRVCGYTAPFLASVSQPKVTVIFGFVPILAPNVISHTLLPIAALNRQSLRRGPACFRIPGEPQCEVVTTLVLETEPAATWARLAPCESLWKHCPRMLPRGPSCWRVHLSDEILTP